MHNTTSRLHTNGRIRLSFWGMKTTAYYIPVHQFKAKFEMSYTHLFEYIRQDKDRIRLVLSCKWDFTIKLTNNIVALTCEFRKKWHQKKGTGKNDWGGKNGTMGI